ncbi:hypothetical protein ACFFX0_01125 [Citricoccus parietis]|uniref:Uncharacterized protein n=1 Tax=Citricoccus parietis TaxID=592307 RepID=A0ABV5FT60_9MICC
MGCRGHGGGIPGRPGPVDGDHVVGEVLSEAGADQDLPAPLLGDRRGMGVAGEFHGHGNFFLIGYIHHRTRRLRRSGRWRRRPRRCPDRSRRPPLRAPRCPRTRPR